MRAITPRIAVTVAALAGSLAWPTAAPAEPAPAQPPHQIAPPAAPEPPAAPAASRKTPSFELIDHGESVEVIAHNIKAARTAILPMRSRLEIPIVAGPVAKRIVPGDATVKLIELDSEDAVRVLSVKLGFERADVKALARFAQAIQVGDDLHVLVPRKLPADGTASKLPEPTLPPALAAAVARADLKPQLQLAPSPAPPAPAPAAGPELPPPAKPEISPALAAAVVPVVVPAIVPAIVPTRGPIPMPMLGPAPRPDAKPALPSAAALPPSSDAARSEAAKPTRDSQPLTQVLASEQGDRWSKISMYGVLGLAAAGAGIWLMRRRRAQLLPATTIDVVAQRSLGGKARIVWLSAGPREMIVAVTGQQISLLGQWRKSDAAAEPSRELTRELPAELGLEVAAPLPMAHTHADIRLDDRAEPADKPLSPAVSGILRLRGRTAQFTTPQPLVDDAVATGDIEADAAWAKEILAATGARR